MKKSYIFKRIIAIILTIALLFGENAMMVSAAGSKRKQKNNDKYSWIKKDGDYLYQISLEDGTAIFMGYTGKKTKLTIPKKIAGKKVTTVGGMYSKHPSVLDLEFAEKNDKIKEVIIPGYIKCIEDSAFSFCKKLQKVTMKNGVTKIGSRAFGECRKLESVNLPDTITEVEGYAFWNSGIKEIKLPPMLETIEDSAFSGCYQLEKVEFPNNLVRIGANAFSGCALKEVIIPESVKSIGEASFSNCVFLEKFTLSSASTVLGSNVFFYSNNLTEVTLPDGLVNIGSGAFSGTKWLENKKKANPMVVVNGVLIDGSALSGSVVVPTTVSRIGDGAFAGNKEITEAYIPDTVTSIGEEAFYNSTLKNVTIPKNNTEIGDNAFEGTEWINNQSKNTPLLIINNKLVSGKNATGDVVVPEGVTEICGGAFANCKADSIILPKSVKRIGARAFYEAAAKSITMNEGISSIEDSAFRFSGIESLTVPGSVEKIGAYAFYGCDNLKRVVYSAKAKEVGGEIFGTDALTDVQITEGVTAIAPMMFMNCSNLSNINLPNSIKTIGAHAFWDCDALKRIDIPASVEYIDYYAFADANIIICISNKACKIYDDKDTIGGIICAPKGSVALKYAEKYGNTANLSKVTGSKKSLKVKWKKQKDVKSYQIQYATNGKFKKAKTVKINNVAKNSTKIKGLKERQKYYVRIRVADNNMHSVWSDVMTATTK